MKENYIKQSPMLSLPSLGGGANTSLHQGSQEENYWVSTFGDVGYKENFIPRSVDVDKTTGAVYTLGSFTHSAGVYNQQYTDDLFLLKWDKNGNIEWQRSIGSTGNSKSDRGYTVKIGLVGDVYFSAYTFDNSFSGQNGPNWLIGKMNNNGTLQWMRIVGGSGSEDLYNMYLGTNDAIYCCGMTNGSIWYSNNWGLVARFSPSTGILQWVRYFGNSGSNRDTETYSIAVNSSGDYHIACTHQDSGAKTVLAKYDNYNNRYWGEILNTGVTAAKQDIALDTGGNVYMVSALNSGQDISVTKWNSGGTRQWHYIIDSSSGFSLTPRAIDVDVSGNIYITGSGYIDPNQDGQFDAPVLKLSNSGVTILSQLGLGVASSQSTTGTNTNPLFRNDEAYDITVTDNAIYLCGTTESLDTNSASTTGGTQNYKGFVAKIPNDDGATLTGVYDVSANSSSNSLRYMTYGGLGTVGGVTYSPTSQTTDYISTSVGLYQTALTFTTGSLSSNINEYDATSAFDIDTTINFNPTHYAIDGVTGYTTGQHPAFP